MRTLRYSAVFEKTFIDDTDYHDRIALFEEENGELPDLISAKLWDITTDPPILLKEFPDLRAYSHGR